jgi:hypothetical protein
MSRKQTPVCFQDTKSPCRHIDYQSAEAKNYWLCDSFSYSFDLLIPSNRAALDLLPWASAKAD